MNTLKINAFAVVFACNSHAALTFSLDPGQAIAQNGIADAFDVGATTQAATVYTGTWSDSALAIGGIWSLGITDISLGGTGPNDDQIFFRNQSFQTGSLGGVDNGEGFFLTLDGNHSGSNFSEHLQLDFSFSTTTIGAPTVILTPAFAVGSPDGLTSPGAVDSQGFFLPTDGILNADGSPHTPVYNTATGRLTFAGNTNSNDHLYSVGFENTTSISVIADTQQTDSFGFGLIVTTVPEPSSAILLGIGSLALVFRRKR